MDFEGWKLSPPPAGEVGSAGVPQTSKTSAAHLLPPTELARQVDLTVRAPAARWSLLIRSRFSLEQHLQKGRRRNQPGTNDRRAVRLRGVSGCGAHAKRCCLDMCCRHPTRAGQVGRAAAPPALESSSLVTPEASPGTNDFASRANEEAVGECRVGCPRRHFRRGSRWRGRREPIVKR